MERKISLLDWLIIFAALIMLAVIYIPSSIWQDEVHDRRESRRRMTIIADAQEFFKELTGYYTTDGKELFALVEAAMDSLIADTLFTGDQVIKLASKEYNVKIMKGFDVRVDTTFSEALELERTIYDTLFAVEMYDPESGSTITEHVKKRILAKVQQDSLFRRIVSSEIDTIKEEYTDYLRNKYHLTADLLHCPLTSQPYIFEINDSDPEFPIFSVKSPVPADYTERRFYIFKYEAGNHGHILDGEPTWAERS